MIMHTKKAWHFFAFIGTFEVLDNLIYPITTSKAHAIGGSVVALLWVDSFESVQVSKAPVYKLLHFFLFYGVHKRVMRFFS